MALIRSFAAASASAAAFSLAMPAAALDLPQPVPVSAHHAPAAHEGETAHNHRWDRYRGRNRIDAGDVIAGVLILGTIAAVANAGNRNRDRVERRPPPFPDDNYRYRSGEYDRDGRDGRGLDRAVDMCVDEIERGQDRVGEVDGANRTGEGWSVSGALESGAGFTCRIDNMGRIRAVDIGGSRAAFEPVEDRQYDEDVYARARMAQGGTYSEPGVLSDGEEDTRPEWNPEPPPLPSGDDGRYGASQSPDFEQGG